MKKLIIALALGAVSFSAAAADVKRGEELVKKYNCASCHGAGGNSTIVANPKLAGQVGTYIHKQLVDFTTPQRNNPVMSTYAKMLTEEDKRNIAAYLATQKVKPGAAKNKDTVELGRKIYRGGIADRGVAVVVDGAHECMTTRGVHKRGLGRASQAGGLGGARGTKGKCAMCFRATCSAGS